jgi:hypothetical protein
MIPIVPALTGLAVPLVADGWLTRAAVVGPRVRWHLRRAHRDQMGTVLPRLQPAPMCLGGGTRLARTMAWSYPGSWEG